MAFILAIPTAAMTDEADPATWDLSQALGQNVPDGGGTFSGLTNGTEYKFARLSALSAALTPAAQNVGNVVQSNYADSNDYAYEISPQFASAPTAGNLIMLIGSKDKDQQDITPPAGFTVARNVSDGNGASVFVAYKISDGSETGPLTITTISGQRGSFYAVEIEGTFPANPIGQASEDFDTTVTRNAVNVPSLTVASPCILVGYATNDSCNGNTFSLTTSNPAFSQVLVPAVMAGFSLPALIVTVESVPAGTYDFGVSHPDTDQTMAGLLEIVLA